jgi:hypothetical protein
MNSASFILSSPEMQGEVSRFASLSTVLADPNDRAGNHRRKAGSSFVTSLSSLTTAVQGAIDEWAAVHLGGASAEIQAWVGGTRTMLARRRPRGQAKPVVRLMPIPRRPSTSPAARRNGLNASSADDIPW